MGHGRRLTTKQYLMALRICELRDGPACRKCGRRPKSADYPGDASYAVERRRGAGPVLAKLELDHVDGDPFHNAEDGSNWQLLCRTHNLEKQRRMDGLPARGGVARQRVREREQARAKASEEARTEADGREKERARREGHPSTRALREEVDYSQGDASMKVNDITERQYRRWLLDEVRRRERVRRDEAVDAGAEVTGVSVETTPRYLKKLVSAAGPLMLVPDVYKVMWVIYKPGLIEGENTAEGS